MFQTDVLNGKAGIITGGSSGIGLAMARYLVDHGASLTITGRNQEKLDAAAKSLGEKVTTAAGDVREWDQVEQAVETHMQTHGKIDFLINNAAGNFTCPLAKMSSNAFRSVLEIVTQGTFHFSKAVFPAMKQQKYGRIINIGTTYSWGPAAMVGHSGAAKAGVLNLTRTMAVEWGPLGIHSNLIAPGPVKDTEGVRRLMGDPKSEAMLFRIAPTPRFAEGWEIGALALFLLSPLADYINGAAIPIDGGLHLNVPGLYPAGFPIS